MNGFIAAIGIAVAGGFIGAAIYLKPNEFAECRVAAESFLIAKYNNDNNVGSEDLGIFADLPSRTFSDLPERRRNLMLRQAINACASNDILKE